MAWKLPNPKAQELLEDRRNFLKNGRAVGPWKGLLSQ